jgi:peptidoglycan/LPS O-acetylase OafA/YrhL
MGIIRLLLALAVVGGHSNSHSLLKFVGGEVAVQSFFMISGFYMAMIVNTYKTKKDFWISRYLRLFPIYIVCALMTLILVQGVKSHIGNIDKLPGSAIFFLTFTNATIFFQDITMFLGVNNDTLSFVTHFSQSSPPLFQLLLLPQGWSLGIELWFYALAPFLLNKSIRTLVIILFISESIRVLLIGIDYSADPWSYRFFPSELSIFLLGSLAYKFYELNKPSIHNSAFSDLGFAFILLFIISFPYIPSEYQTKKIIFMISLAFLIGNIFSITKNSKIDNFIGMLSYPIYMCHLLVLGFFLPKLNLLNPDGRFYTTLIAYIVVISFSIVLYLLIEKPVESFRRRFKSTPT